MSSALYSSTAPAGWNALPTEIKQKFYDIAGKGDWTAHEAFAHLVPDHLRDNPQEVEVWMDGGTVTTEEWVYDRGRAGGQYEEVTYDIPDRDVSRIEAGANGGEYSVDNTIMEDMSVNRARGGVDMTGEELQATEATNAVDADIIENAFTSTSETTAVITEQATTNIAAEAGEFIFEAVAPVYGAYKAATFVSKRCKTQEDKLGYGALAAAGGAWLMASPLAPFIAVGFLAHASAKLIGRKLSNA